MLIILAFNFDICGLHDISYNSLIGTELTIIIHQNKLLSLYNSSHTSYIDRYVDLLLGEFKHYKTRLAHGGIHKGVMAGSHLRRVNLL